MATTPELNDLQSEIDAFKSTFSVIYIASCDSEGVPEASHAPFVMEKEGSIVVFISELAKHTRNLKETSKASLLLLEGENEASNAFALRRLQYECQAEFVELEAERNACLVLLTDRFGKFIETLSSLGDFRVVRLRPNSGKFVRGFGQTFYLSGSGLVDIEMYKAKG